ncbi:MAG: hypothetical protein JRN15_24090, partial [Nitrososphaerota archaeon]|nr:hypothetical protein [Nitrososphaerota archaeon]
EMSQFFDSAFNVGICNEVLERVKEYGKEGQTISEIKRVTQAGGLLIFGTPNSEFLGGHGFYFDEIEMLVARNFEKYCIFENAFLPFDSNSLEKWEKRLNTNKTGVIISEKYN